jgi:hypothetical protein
VFAPKKVKVLFWVLRHGRTGTWAVLHRHGVIDTPDYPFFAGVEEDSAHLFAACPRLRALWAHHLPRAPAKVQDATDESVAGLFSGLPAALGLKAALGTLWVIWKSRNRRFFDGITLTARAVIDLLERTQALGVPCREED